jgi:hypothetical protein
MDFDTDMGRDRGKTTYRNRDMDNVCVRYPTRTWTRTWKWERTETWTMSVSTVMSVSAFMFKTFLNAVSDNMNRFLKAAEVEIYQKNSFQSLPINLS